MKPVLGDIFLIIGFVMIGGGIAAINWRYALIVNGCLLLLAGYRDLRSR